MTSHSVHGYHYILKQKTPGNTMPGGYGIRITYDSSVLEVYCSLCGVAGLPMSQDLLTSTYNGLSNLSRSVTDPCV